MYFVIECVAARQISYTARPARQGAGGGQSECLEVCVCVRGGVGSGGGRSAGSPEGIDPPRARSSEHLQAAGERLRHASPSRAYGQCGVERLRSAREGVATVHGEGVTHCV